MAGVAFLRSTTGVVRTTTGTQDYTVSGIGTPKGIIVLLTKTINDGSLTNGLGYSIGLCDGTAQVAIGGRSQHNVADSNTSRSFDFTNVINLPSSDGTTYNIQAAFSTWITDGVRLNFTTVDGSAYYVTVIFIAGADAQCKVGNFNMTDHTGTPNQTLDVTGCGFDPKLAFFLSMLDIAGLNTSAANVTQNLSLSLGIGCLNGAGTLRTGLVAFAHRDVRPTMLPSFHSDYGRQVISTGFVGVASGALTKVGPVSLDSFITDGFRAIDVPGGNPPVVAYMAVRLSDREMELSILDADPANADFSVPLTNPGSVLILSTSAAAEGDVTDATGSGVGFGFASQGDQSSHAFYEEDAAATSNNGSIMSTDTAILNPTSTGGSGLDYTASWDDTEFTLTKSSNTYGSARKQFALIIQRPTFTGTGAGNFPLATGTGTGTEEFTGTGAGSFPLSQGAGTAALQFTGTAAGSFPLATGTGAALLEFTGTAAGNFAVPTGTGSGLLEFTGTSAGSFPLATAAGVGTIAFTGTGAGDFPLPQSAGVALLQFTGTADGSFPLATADAAGSTGYDGAGAGSFPIPTADAAGLLEFTGTGVGLLPLATGDGTGAVSLSITGTGAGIFPLALGSGTGIGGAFLACETALEGSYAVVSDLEGSYDLAAELEGSYDVVTDLEGGLCMAVEGGTDTMFAGNRHIMSWAGILADDGVSLVNLTGKVVKFALARKDAAGNPLIGSPVVDLSSSGSQVTITNPVTGSPHVQVELLPANTSSLAPKETVYYWELEVFEGSAPTNPVVVSTGDLTIKPNVVNV